MNASQIGAREQPTPMSAAIAQYVNAAPCFFSTLEYSLTRAAEAPSPQSRRIALSTIATSWWWLLGRLLFVYNNNDSFSCSRVEMMTLEVVFSSKDGRCTIRPSTTTSGGQSYPAKRFVGRVKGVSANGAKISASSLALLARRHARSQPGATFFKNASCFASTSRSGIVILSDADSSIAVLNSGAAAGERRSARQLVAPEDCPIQVTRVGSPPKAATFR
mmetsp:Transcript_53520/g.131072  ORF Transcript_53520/g.131072 Transcript_53520/m.131072 type:complete len:219 (-) Transcript_53520:261-917(-)